MPFLISGNLERLSETALVDFQKKFGIIISENQFFRQQYALIHNAILSRYDIVQVLTGLDKDEIISFLFILSQFGDAVVNESPIDFLRFGSNPYILEWQEGKFMIPWEVIEVFANEKVFRERNYLFSLLHQLSIKEKKAWVKWLMMDYEGRTEKDLNREIYKELRVLQKPFEGKSIITENEFKLSSIWKRGENQIVDWYYKGLTTFYYTMQELSQKEKDSFLLTIINEIKAGKYIIKKEPEKFREREEYRLVATAEGASIQFRDTIFHYEMQKDDQEDFLFHNF